MKRLVTLVALLSLIAVPAVAAPTNGAKTKTVAVQCQGSSVSVIMVPSIGKSLWDVSTSDPSNGPNYMIKTLTQEIFVSGGSIGVFTFNFGKRTGQGAAIACSYQEHFLDGNGAQVDVFGTVHLVSK
jgi:hypothetical protein